ncbi:LOW QUALITY PROTEIN: DNA-directed RNA polymerase III subunit RPC7 [Diretmus argenteus]
MWTLEVKERLSTMGGRGRGIAAFTFNIDALGITRGCMPESRMGPNPLYPDTEFKPVPLKAGEDEDYMRALKQDMRGTMRRLPHNIKPLSGKPEVEKYKERYLKQGQVDDQEWTPDWNLFPRELMPQSKKPRAKPGTKKKKTVKISSKDSEEMLSKLNELEKKDDGNAEKSDEEKEKKKGDDNEEEEIEEEEIEEEELEENDYIDNYFDNGEDFGAGSDENMDAEATY